MSTKIAFYTLGCKSNQYDTEVMKKAVEEMDGYRVVPFEEGADISVINTCSVTTGADRKSRKYIRKAIRDGGLVLVTGCYVTLDSNEIANIDGVDAIFPNSHKYEFHRVLDWVEKGNRGKVSRDEAINWDLDSRGISRDRNHTRAFLKIQDGCDNSCSFCKVRYLRGPTRSKSPEEVVREARNLGDNGFEEIVLTGINLAEYGEGGLKLAELVEKLSRVKEVSRIRLSSINPSGISEDLVKVFNRSEKPCPYFHIPLQSGSNRVLDSMNRNYSREYYLDRINMIKRELSEPTFGTDLMVGFPGEDKEDFEKTKEVVGSVGFINAHVFRYTPREGTPASEYEDDLHSTRKKQRAKELRNLVSSVSQARRRKFRGSKLEMVLEERSGPLNGWSGYSRNYLDLHLPKRELPEGYGSGDTLEVELEKAKEDINQVTFPKWSSEKRGKLPQETGAVADEK